jgi:hypothetical protein
MNSAAGAATAMSSQLGDDGFSMVWGVGPVSASLAQRAGAAVRAGDDPVAGPAEPWAAVVVRADGSVAAAVSTNFLGGLFWAWDPSQGLVFSDRIGDVVSSLRVVPDLDEDYLRGFAVLSVEPQGTPYRGVTRIGGGTTAVWSGASAAPELVQWCGPRSWPQPEVRGEQLRGIYLEAFDRAVDALVPARGPLASTLSGGLDSTFAVASLVRHATADRPIHAFCHSPRPDARLEGRGNWDPDDLPLARLMAASRPGLIEVTPVVAEDGQTPLEAAEVAARAAWIPTLNPGNQVWMNAVVDASRGLGAQVTMVGTHGNAAFSYEHAYALRHHLLRGEFTLAARSVRARDATPLKQHVRSQVASPLLTPLVSRVRGTNTWLDYQRLIGLGHAVGRDMVPDSRTKFLDFLRPGVGFGAAMAGANRTAPYVDPFTSREVIDLAARIVPAQWQQGPGPRGLARLLGEGRVPDEIRLRTRRGGQAWDEWFLMRHERQRYAEEIDKLSETPVLGGWVDHVQLRRQHESWPWGEVEGPPSLAVLALNRILSLGSFVRMTSERLDALRVDAAQGGSTGSAAGVFRVSRSEAGYVTGEGGELVGGLC